MLLLLPKSYVGLDNHLVSFRTRVGYIPTKSKKPIKVNKKGKGKNNNTTVAISGPVTAANGLVFLETLMIPISPEEICLNK